MSNLKLPDYPVLQPEAVDLLTAIRDHLDVPMPAEGDRDTRRAWRNLTDVRIADVIAALNHMLCVPAVEATQTAADLRRYTADSPVRYTTWEGSK